MNIEKLVDFVRSIGPLPVSGKEREIIIKITEEEKYCLNPFIEELNKSSHLVSNTIVPKNVNPWYSRFIIPGVCDLKLELC